MIELPGLEGISKIMQFQTPAGQGHLHQTRLLRGMFPPCPSAHLNPYQSSESTDLIPIYNLQKHSQN